MMMTSASKDQKEKRIDGKGLIDLVFSWSLSDVLNQHLYKGKVNQIPMTFESSSHYMKSFMFPLIEETHADLLSKVQTVFRAPTREILYAGISNDEAPMELSYDVLLRSTTLWEKENSQEIYEPEFGDLIALTEVKPKCIDDLDRPQMPYNIAFVERADEDYPDAMKMLCSQPIKFETDTDDNEEEEKGKKEKRVKLKRPLYAVHLTNMVTNIRIWMALNSQLEGDNMNIIEKVLQTDSITEPDCNYCFQMTNQSSTVSEARDIIRSYELDDSQKAALLSCVVTRGCNHQKDTVKLIWGPPGTGKTKMASSLLFVLFRVNCRTLTCAPTNIAVLGVAKRLVGLVKDAIPPECDTYGLGDLVLFGNRKRMKIDDHEDLKNVFLRNRVHGLCRSYNGWRSNVEDMILLLQQPEQLYDLYTGKNKKDKEVEEEKDNGEEETNAESVMEKSPSSLAQTSKENLKHNMDTLHKKKTQLDSDKAVDKKSLGSKENEEGRNDKVKLKTFEEFIMSRFTEIGNKINFCFENLWTHLPTSYISQTQAGKMIRGVVLCKSIGASLRKSILANEDLREILKGNLHSSLPKEEFLEILEFLVETLSKLPKLAGSFDIQNFCLNNARLIFCTVSSSAKLHMTNMTPIELVIIDEAAQLKECDSTIPLQLNGLQHAILVGDEQQLPAMVQSKKCEDAGFGRSLFERLATLGKKKNMLEVQYRMHPSISLFPNKQFYDNRISDGPNVKETKYEKKFLEGTMYGPYSFINVAYGEETLDNRRSTRNMVEAAIVVEIVASLSKESFTSRKKMRVGCISPYKAQVFAIQEKLGKKYSSDAKSNFSVSVRSVDGFQGGEEDIIIISTVRCNGRGVVGFMSNLQRTNVALTRARHCLWVIGNGTTLISSGSVWKMLVLDANERGCYYNAMEDKNLVHAVKGALIELQRFDTLLKEDSLLFSNTVWKVQLSDNFKRSMSCIRSVHVCKQVFSLLEQLSNGWRLHQRNKVLGNVHGASSEFLEVYSINRDLNLVWSIEVIKQNSKYIQTLKVWDVVSSGEIPKLAEALDQLFGKYTVDTMNRCKCKIFERNVAVPMTWPAESSQADANSMKFLDSRIALLNLKG